MKTLAMDKLFATAVISVLGLGITASQASAFGCCRCGWVEGHQYNAFSPYCIDGCRYKCCRPLCHRCNWLPVHNMGPACCQPPMPYPCCDVGPTCCDQGELPPAQGPAFKAPMPTPSQSQAPPTGTSMQGWPQNYAPLPVQSTGYQPMYYPGYAPMPGMGR